jgi:hypothetical protein
VTSRLSNSVREAVLKLTNGAALLRTYEGLLLNGYQGGQIVTRPQLFAALQGLVGEHSIKAALQALAPQGEPLLVELPSPRPPSPADADTRVEFSQANKCFVERQKPPESQTEAEMTDEARPAHRPCKYYRLPTEDELCAKLDVERSLSDPIRRDDLASAKRYREALERELMKRRPGQYPQGWLADRLGVTARSIRNYHREIPIQARACFSFEQVTWENYQRMLPSAVIAKRTGIDIRGRFLEDETGKRYPAKEGVAQRLLGRNHLVWLKQSTYNDYWYGEAGDRLISDGLHELGEGRNRQAKEGDAQARLETKISRVDGLMRARWAEGAANSAASDILDRATPPVRAVKPEPCRDTAQIDGSRGVEQPMPGEGRRRKRAWCKPLVDAEAEALVQQIYTKAGERSQQAMSVRNARRLVDAYGASAVEAAFKKMLWLREHGQMTNPAGFMVVASRVSWRVQQGQTEPGMRAPRLEAERRRKQRADPKVALEWRCLRELVLVTSDEYCMWRAGWEMERGDWMEAGYWLSRADVEFPW